MNFSQIVKDIPIGQLIKARCNEVNIPDSRLDAVLVKYQLSQKEVFESKSLETELLLKLSKLLEYDFFRIYTQHLILYAPSASQKTEKTKSSTLPYFRKNIYTVEIIQFILEKITTKEKTVNEIIEYYKIPKTTLYKWLAKYT